MKTTPQNPFARNGNTNRQKGEKPRKSCGFRLPEDTIKRLRRMTRLRKFESQADLIVYLVANAELTEIIAPRDDS